MAYEDRIIRGLDAHKNRSSTEMGFHANLKDAHERAKKILREEQISPQRDFGDIYDPKLIARHREYVRTRREQFGEDDENREYATVLEAILLEHIELSNWFGDRASTIKTSEYDDIANGIDLIVRYDPETLSHEPSLLGLGVDVTFSSSGAAKKIERVFEKIERGELSTIQYYRSEKDSIRGERTNIPLITLGMEKQMLEEIGSLWLSNNKSALAKHPAQNLLLHEAEIQLVTMQETLRKYGHTDKERFIAGPLATIRAQIKQKGLVALGRDKVFDSIKEAVRKQQLKQP